MPDEQASLRPSSGPKDGEKKEGEKKSVRYEAKLLLGSCFVQVLATS